MLFKVRMTGKSITAMGDERYYVLAVHAESEAEALKKARGATDHYTVYDQQHDIVDPATPTFPSQTEEIR